MQFFYKKLRTILTQLLARLPDPESPKSSPESSPSSNRPTEFTKPHKQRKPINVTTLQTRLMELVIKPLNLGVEGSEIIEAEIHWLCAAAEHLLKIEEQKVLPAAPVPIDIPSEVEQEALTNTIRPSLDDFARHMLAEQVDHRLQLLDIHLRNLTIELDRETKMGGPLAAPLALLNSIKLQRQAVIEKCQELSQLMYEVYGVRVHSFDKLLEFLE
jgi:hypothetical protein